MKRLLCIAVSLIGFVPSFRAAAPDPRQIIAQSVVANDADWQALVNYSHREQDIHGKADSQGNFLKQQSKSYEVLMIEGTPYNRLIAINGKPLAPAQEEREKRKLKQEMAKRAKESPDERQARLAKYKQERADDHLLMQQITKAFRFNLVREETMDGHESYVLDAVPDPSYRPPVAKARVLTGMKGRLWVAKDGHHWVRVEAEVIKPVEFGGFLAKVNPGTRFELVQAPVDGVWLPKRFTQRVNARILGVYGLQNRDDEEYTEYRLVKPAAATDQRPMSR